MSLAFDFLALVGIVLGVYYAAIVDNYTMATYCLGLCLVNLVVGVRWALRDRK